MGEAKEYWISFFREAGLPDQAEIYASRFVDNRMHSSVLCDLNESHFIKMGITAVGDILIIQRHIKLINKSDKVAMATSKSDGLMDEPPLKKLCRISPIKTDFQSILTKDWFTDKTMMIREVIDLLLSSAVPEEPSINRSDPLLITAPRRFGKSTNLDMLRCFFGGLVSNETFMGLNIGQHENAMKWWNHFNTISITFGRFTNAISTKDDCIQACRSILHHAYVGFKFISSHLPEHSVIAFKEWVNEKTYLNKTETEVGNGIVLLLQCIRDAGYEKPFLLLIDEFDRICSRAVFKTDESNLDDIIQFYCDMVGNVVKFEPECLCVLTGVAAVTCKGLSSLNNVRSIHFLRYETFAKFYGITSTEFELIMSNENISLAARQQKDEAYKWYNGYKYNDTEILNTYSVVNFVETGTIRSYWKESGTVEGLNESINQELVRREVMKLLDGERLTVTLIDSLRPTNFCKVSDKTYQLMDSNLIMNFLLQQGYICIDGNVESNKVYLKVPNIEIKQEFQESITRYFKRICTFDPTMIAKCCKIFVNMDMHDENACRSNLKEVKQILNKLINKTEIPLCNEAWFESLLFHIFVEAFTIKEQKKIEETAKEGDLRTATVLDLFILREDRSFVFEETINRTAAGALMKLLDKQYYTEATKRKLPYLLIGINVNVTPNAKIVSMRFLYNTTTGEGEEVE